MKLYCRDGVVLAWHEDSQDVPVSAYGEGVYLISLADSLDSLDRIGEPPAEGEPDLRPYVAPAPDLIALAAAARWKRETGGIVVAGQGIATDRGSQAMITGAFSLIQAQPDTAIRFKAKSGFVELSADQMSTIAVAVAQHVQACFALEAEVVAQIESGAITTQAGVEAAFG